MMRFLNEKELASLERCDLQKLFLDIRSAIYVSKRKKEDVRDLEIYHCYITRELQNREDSLAKIVN